MPPESSSDDPVVTALVVTYNRADLLRECLRALEAQTTPLTRVLVVDNASRDETAQVLRGEFPQVEVLSLQTNLGGAGGFAAGLQDVFASEADLVWVMDDDTVPAPTALEELVGAWERGGRRAALLASRVVWVDGRDHPMNTPRRRWPCPSEKVARAEMNGAVPVRSASFVSILLDVAQVRTEGLPVAAYFLWNDDFEYTLRILRGREGWLVPGSVVEHRTKSFGGSKSDPGERFYYEVRNKLWLLTRSRSLEWWERPLRLLVTLRNWAQTFQHSTARLRLLRVGVQGMWAGLSSSPRPTQEILREAGVG